MNTFFTSDLHLNHKKILLYENRPYEDVREMNEALIKNWNSVVGDRDHCYVLGDFCWGNPEPFMKRLKGRKFLVRGNHDHYSDTKYQKIGFSGVWIRKELKIDKKTIVLDHFPLESWNKSCHGSLHFHGHVHSKGTPRRNRLNVGVDVCEMFPLEFEECLQEIQEINGGLV